MKALVVNDEIKSVGLPTTGRLKDGREVSNYHLLPVGTLAAEGWIDIEDNPPTYDDTTHQLQHNGYKLSNGKVVVDYLVTPIPPPPPPEPDYEAEFINAVTAATNLAELKAALVGNRGPGAEARRGRP